MRYGASLSKPYYKYDKAKETKKIIPVAPVVVDKKVTPKVDPTPKPTPAPTPKPEPKHE